VPLEASKDGVRTLTNFPSNSPVGERMANIALRDPFGQRFDLYAGIEGRPALVVFLKNREQCAALAAKADALAGFEPELFAIVAAEPQALSALDVPFASFCDSGGRITARFEAWAFGPSNAHGQASLPFGFLLDANQRVAQVWRGDLGNIIANMARHLGNVSQTPAEIFAGSAPVLVLPRLFDGQTCRALIDLWVQGDPFEGTVGTVGDGDEFNRVYHEKKRRLDLSISDPDLHKRLVMMVGQRIAPELEKAYHFSNFFFERFLVVCYDAARRDHFSPHRDNLSPGTAERRFALTVNLNDDYEGGGVAFPEYSSNHYRPEAGGVLLFSCSLIHEALPITRGRRFALLNFVRQRSPCAPGSR
jgi:hypothetical protein